MKNTKKFRKIVASSLAVLICAINSRVNGKEEININKNNYNYNKQENLSQINSNNNKCKRFVNIIQENKGKVIAVSTALVTYIAGREGIYNSLFPGSNKVWYLRTFSDSEIDLYEKNAIKERLTPISFKTEWGILRGFAYFPKNINNQDIKKIILVCNGNSEISCTALEYVINKSSDEDKKNSIFLCFDYPTYGKSEGPALSQKVMQKYAEYILNCAEELNKYYNNAKLSLWGFSLGGYPISYLSKYEKVNEVSLWSPVKWDAAVEGLTGLSKLGFLTRYWAFGGAEFNSIKNIQNSHENCKVNLFFGSLESGDFLSSEVSVLKNRKNEEKIADEDMSRETWQTIVKENKNKNGLDKRLTVSFLKEANHGSHAFDNSVWNLTSIWNYKKEQNRIEKNKIKK